ncbi:Methyltransferase domain-containing protein [Sulfobacillus thermosulfidooxidans DSM 9293]|uniref:Methyltransferase domain-containing protein n=2 Tax=Sulfobacillus thermosulfidooxidans TaxID=28034 RepID=A0A1W1WGF3_SULTA|nr:class I SAM-dependent methyltransferase [Sulfobacillus thermosulfidooxidans]PSR21062.1 MAG: SAM-dependent methyltransferase [Sulfobacillus thermosulfidooxidans]SMC05374.1 Methyltransferase domain-containing protein [Sulfobacillus thermosulfidooxidans DSM 9293]
MARFDPVADRYDAFCATPLGSFVEAVERQMVAELLDPHPGERVVDLGCGTGTYALWMADAGCAVVGVDESEAMLAKARSKRMSSGRVEGVRGDLTHLPWASASFDAGLMQVTLEFVDHPEAILIEAMRIIKPGGRLILGLIHGTGPWARHYRTRAQADPTSVYHGAHFWTLAELTSVMAMEPSQIRDRFAVIAPAMNP